MKPNLDLSNVPVAQGQSYTFVTDKRLAAALLAVGIPLLSHVTLRKGDEVFTKFTFAQEDKDREFKTADLIVAWSQDLSFIQANDRHPFTYAMCALKNYQTVMDSLGSAMPYVPMRRKGSEGNAFASTLWVKEGSKKHAAALRKGMVEIPVS